ncbi:MAG: glycosyltransferase family 2 protein, partial [Candidatus Poseidoniaceae archaeon]|nr:glycosyltransferase family 2 protein [Candidatus Poseidoniaceae archaeon]
MVQSLRWARPIIVDHSTPLMHTGWAVGVVIPARDEERHIADVLNSIPEWVDAIVVVDDHSTDATALKAQTALQRRNLEGWSGKWWIQDLSVCKYAANRSGVGAAIDSGMQFLLAQAEAGIWCEQDAQWCAAVMDGDGQMCAGDLNALVTPLVEDRADHAKGNRSMHQLGLTQMPPIRRIGTWILTHLTNLASGMTISDPQSGYAVSSHEVIKNWDFSRKWDVYGYPNHRLIELARGKWRVQEIPVRGIYNGSRSHLRIPAFFAGVALLLWSGLFQRGWDWYVLGNGRGDNLNEIGLLARATVVGMWFSGWSSLLACVPVAYVLESWTYLGIFAAYFVLAMLLCRVVDR